MDKYAVLLTRRVTANFTPKFMRQKILSYAEIVNAIPTAGPWLGAGKYYYVIGVSGPALDYGTDTLGPMSISFQGLPADQTLIDRLEVVMGCSVGGPGGGRYNGQEGHGGYAAPLAILANTNLYTNKPSNSDIVLGGFHSAAPANTIAQLIGTNNYYFLAGAKGSPGQLMGDPTGQDGLLKVPFESWEVYLPPNTSETGTGANGGYGPGAGGGGALGDAEEPAGVAGSPRGVVLFFRLK